MDRNADISSLVIKAFTKLKSSLYYEKNNLHLRQQMVDFCSEEIGQKLDNLANRLSNGDGFDDELKKIGIHFNEKFLTDNYAHQNKQIFIHQVPLVVLQAKILPQLIISLLQFLSLRTADLTT